MRLNLDCLLCHQCDHSISLELLTKHLFTTGIELRF